MKKTPKEELIVSRLAQKEELATPLEEDTGFLPFETNSFDRLFISVVIWIAFSLFWFRFIEPFGLSIWISNIISFLLGIIIMKKG